MNKREGIIKFNCDWVRTGPLVSPQELRILNQWRDILFQVGLIGSYDDGTGYGNLSIRAVTHGRFIISGSGTGKLPRLEAKHYTHVVSCDTGKNRLACRGPVRASSESLTHFALYEQSREINGVIHVHSPEYWEKLIGTVPTTHKEIEYGTPALALEIKRLFRETDVAEKKIIALGGHPEGIITFGKNLAEAGTYLLAYINALT